MPVAVVVSVVVLVLLGLTFCVVPVAALRYGEAAERAAEREVLKAGLESDVLVEHRVRFKESASEALLPFGIAAVLFVLAGLDLAGVGPARIASWVFAGLLFFAGGFITAGQILAARFTQAAFRRSSDPAVRNLDAQAIVDAAGGEFPGWLRPVQYVRFALTTVGSALVIVLLATPAAGAHFG
ncbi:hypothetical protein AB0E69_07200 [Kribbella sp. NPDC026611]|uniref:hypothetical protein n=1 Tax=Kribbella sp. NPDC026611 TaxID=3154911 RepID=UPI0033ED9CC7